MSRKIDKYISITLGGIFFISALLYCVSSNFTIGTWASFVLGFVLLGYGVFHKYIYPKIPKWLLWVSAFVLLFIIVFIIAVYACGSKDTVSYDEDAIIVLGAGIKGETVGKTLRLRLDTTLDYLEQNPNAYVVVSGGQGPYESISEAEAMKRYLISRGVSAEKIIKEDKSTSTEENFAYSKALLDAEIGGDLKLAYVTNGFHIYRARGFAERAGIENPTHIHAKTPWHTIIPNGLREMLAILKMWVFD